MKPTQPNYLTFSTKQPSTSPPHLKSLHQYTRKLIHLKNAIHDGYFTESMKRQGPGITILDNGTIIVGNFKNDQSHGLSLVFINKWTYFMGELNRGALDGPFVMRTNNLTFYSTFNNNKFQGELLIIDYQNAVAKLWAIEQNGQGQICKQMDLHDIIEPYFSYSQKQYQESPPPISRTHLIPKQPLILKQMSPYIQQLPSIQQYIALLKSGTKQFQGMGNNIFTYSRYQNNSIITLLSHKIQYSQFLGLVINKNQQIIAYGQFKKIFNQLFSTKSKMNSYEYQYYLDGLGMLEEQIVQKCNKSYIHTKVTYCGQFIDKKLHGQGFKSLQGDKTIYGKFTKGEIRAPDILQILDDSSDQIKKLLLKKMKNIHIHSLKFHNNYANQRPIFILNNLLKQIQNKSDNQQLSDHQC